MSAHDQQYKRDFAALAEKYGSPYEIPVEEIHQIREILRAKHAIDANPGENPAEVMRRYAIPQSVIKELTGLEYEAPARKEKRVDKYSKILDWCKANVGVETTIYTIAEVGDVSYSTANNFVKDRIDLFRKVKKGLYIVRDPETERAADK